MSSLQPAATRHQRIKKSLHQVARWNIQTGMRIWYTQGFILAYGSRVLPGGIAPNPKKLCGFPDCYLLVICFFGTIY